MKLLLFTAAVLISTVTATFYKPIYKKYRKAETFHLVKASDPHHFKPSDPYHKGSGKFNLVKASHDMYDPMMHRGGPGQYPYPEPQPYHETPYVGGAEYPGFGQGGPGMGAQSGYGPSQGPSGYMNGRYESEFYPGAKHQPSFFKPSYKSPRRSGKLY